MIVGGNIGKNKVTPNDRAHEDYVICFNALHPYVDYFVVNVSSPNTPGLRELQKGESFEELIRALVERNKELSQVGSTAFRRPEGSNTATDGNELPPEGDTPNLIELTPRDSESTLRPVAANAGRWATLKPLGRH